jgi:magnesium chelatase subunit H
MILSYGRNEKGAARPEILDTLFKSTVALCSKLILSSTVSQTFRHSRILRQYRSAQKSGGAAAKTKRHLQLCRKFFKNTIPQKLEELLLMEYRTKLLNPKLAHARAI